MEAREQSIRPAFSISQSDESRVNSSATVGTEPGGTYWYSMDRNPLTHAGLPHTYRHRHMTENHGGLGSNPGSATY